MKTNKNDAVLEEVTALVDMAELYLNLSTTCKKLAECVMEVNGIRRASGTAPEEPVKQASDITLEDVRTVLAEKSRAGKTEEVRALILRFGAEKLSEIDPGSYEALLKEAEVI